MELGEQWLGSEIESWSFVHVFKILKLCSFSLRLSLLDSRVLHDFYLSEKMKQLIDLKSLIKLGKSATEACEIPQELYNDG